MAQSTITKVGALTDDVATQINSNFTELYAASAGGEVTVDGVQTLTNKTLTAPILTTPTLGVATATSINKLTLTAPTASATLTIADGKSLTVSNILALAGTDSTTMTFPTTSATIARTDAANTFTGVQTMTSPALTTPSVTGGTLTSSTLASTINTDWKVLAAPITYTSNVTPAVITGFSWTVVPGTYVFEVNLPTTMTTVGGMTISFVLTTAVLTSIQYQTYASTASDNTLAVSTSGTTTTSATKVFDSKASAYTVVKVYGSMVVGTGGTFQWDGCQNTSAGAGDVSIILLGAMAMLTRVA